jgi:predicted nucleotidyltransferase/DNA-binding XRE family transcriptional regulator
MPIVESAGALLKHARQQAGLTQSAMSARAGVTQSVISLYESGRRQPSLPVLLDLIAATGHDLDVTLRPTSAGPARGTRPRPLSGPVGRRLRRRRAEVAAVAATHGARVIGVFGSVARGSEIADSDIDLLVDLPAGAGLFALGRLRRDLEELLRCPVDLVPRDGLKTDVRAQVEADLVEL